MAPNLHFSRQTPHLMHFCVSMTCGSRTVPEMAPTGQLRAQSVQRALLGKELRRFAASPNYMLNCGLGIVMLPAAGIALLIKGRALAQLLDGVFGAGADIVPVLLSAALCLLATMNLSLIHIS